MEALGKWTVERVNIANGWQGNTVKKGGNDF